MATGKVIQITGPVIDVEFPPGELPSIYNALEIKRPSTAATGTGDDTLVVEVQQHLGQQLGADGGDVDDRRPRPRARREGHRRPDHRPGRRGHARPRVRRPRPPDRRQGAGDVGAHAADPPRPAAVLRDGDRGAGLRDGHQGHRPHRPVQARRQGRRLRRRRRREDGHHPGADPQHRRRARRLLGLRRRRRALARGERPHR